MEANLYFQTGMFTRKAQESQQKVHAKNERNQEDMPSIKRGQQSSIEMQVRRCNEKETKLRIQSQDKAQQTMWKPL